MHAQLKREFICLFASPQGVWVSLAFCLGVFLLLPFVLDAQASSLPQLFSAMLWISIFFSLFLTIDSFYHIDYAHQIFHHAYVNRVSFLSLVSGKIFYHSVFVLFLHMLMLPFLGLLYDVPLNHMGYLIPYLSLGVVTLAMLVHFAQILIISLNQKGMLALMVLLPMVIPVLIFASSCCHQSLAGQDAANAFMYLGAIFLLTLAILPYTSAKILIEALRQ